MSKPRTETWVMFPYVGLELITASGLRRPIFKRFTVISRSHFRQLSRNMAECAPRGTGQRQVVQYLEQLGGDFDSLLAVRQTARTVKDLFEAAHENAKLFGAVINIAAFSTHQASIWGCSLLEKLPIQHEEKALAVTLSPPSVSVSRRREAARARSVYYRQGNYKLTTRRLRELLYDSSLAFGKILLSGKKIDRSIHDTLSTALLTFDEALHQDDPQLQLVHCVTTLEVLFSFKSDFKRLESRLEVILNPATLAFLKANEIFNARHRIVHEGAREDLSALTFKARTLAFASIVLFAQLSSRFQKKSYMLQSLDLIREIPSLQLAYRCKAQADQIATRKAFASLFNVKYFEGFLVKDSLCKPPDYWG